MSTVQPRGFSRPIGRSTRPYAGRIGAANRQPGPVSSNAIAARRQSDRVGSIAGRSGDRDARISTVAHRQPNREGSVAGRNRVSDPRTSTAANRQSFVKNHASEHHDGNWHRDWDRHHAHFHNHKVFVFVNGFWWGLYPWDYYPYFASGYPYDNYGDYPYDNSGYPYDYNYSGNPYSYYNYYPYSDEDQSDYAGSSESPANSTVSAVQSELAKLGYYNGAIDGALGDQTEAALARYQQDRDLSVTGTVDAATLQSLGIK
jgi:putative peptidoglycan binding protein